jgi:hypothetical protein
MRIDRKEKRKNEFFYCQRLLIKPSYRISIEGVRDKEKQ